MLRRKAIPLKRPPSVHSLSLLISFGNEAQHYISLWWWSWDLILFKTFNDLKMPPSLAQRLAYLELLPLYMNCLHTNHSYSTVSIVKARNTDFFIYPHSRCFLILVVWINVYFVINMKYTSHRNKYDIKIIFLPYHKIKHMDWLFLPSKVYQKSCICFAQSKFKHTPGFEISN